MIKLRLLLGQWLAKLTRKLRNNFYLYLAALLTLFVLLDASVFHVGENMRDKAFDLMVKHRIVTPIADKDIIIVDINEASLAAMSADYGRWPWPRQVLGEFLENIEVQQPQAVIFDILFSDPDIYNPDSDTYFNDTISATNNTYFPYLRLPESQDNLSKITPQLLPNISEQTLGSGKKNATFAVVLPHFKAALESKRLGTHNITPDKDGVVREYQLYSVSQGWLIPSLPKTIAQTLNYPLPKSQSVLINWRGDPFTYHYVTFSDVFNDMTSKNKTRPQDEFKNKIVIIGATAASLGDIKATTMAAQYPGVEILATAIDNVKHNDYLKVWRGSTPYILLSLLLVWLTALAFYKNVDRDRLNGIFSFSQIGLLTLSYLAINFTDSYLDLTSPILWAVGYFSIAKIYALATDRALQRWLSFGLASGDTSTRSLMMIMLIESQEPLGYVTLKKVARQAELFSKTPNSIEILKGTQSGIWGLFGDMLVFTWSFAEDNPAFGENARLDASHIIESFPAILVSIGLPKDTPIRCSQHEVNISNDHKLDNQWRSLFAQTVLKLEHDEI